MGNARLLNRDRQADSHTDIQADIFMKGRRSREVGRHTDNVHFARVPQRSGVDIVLNEREKRLLYLQIYQRQQHSTTDPRRRRISDKWEFQRAANTFIGGGGWHFQRK